MPLITVGIDSGSTARQSARATSPSTPFEAISFDRIFHDHAPFVWRTLRRLGVHEPDVEDTCQEVFLIVHRRLGDFEGRSSLRTWLYGICVRVTSEYRRRPHRKREEMTVSMPEESIEAPQDDALDRRRALALLDTALEKLDDDKRAVFILYEIEQIPMAEIAEALRCPLQTAYSRLHAARRQVESAMRSAQEGQTEERIKP